MASYKQALDLWLKGERKRLYYLVGPDRIMVEDFVDMVRTGLKVRPTEYHPLSAAEADERDIWATINAYPTLHEDRRLVIVRDAERLRQPKHLLNWLESRLVPQTTVVMVDARDRVDTTTEHMGRAVKTGRLVQCGPTNDEDAMDYLGRITPLDRATFEKLMRHAGGDLARAANACKKAAASGAPMSERTVPALCTRSVGEAYEDALVRLDKARAAEIARLVPDDGISRCIGALDYQLDALLRLNAAVKRSDSVRDIMAKSRVQGFLVKALLPLAKHYDRTSVAARTSALVLADAAYQQGHREGVLEMLAAAW